MPRAATAPSYSELPAEKDDERVRPECEEQLESCSQKECTEILILCMRAEAMEINAIVRMAHRRNKNIGRAVLLPGVQDCNCMQKRPNLMHAICCNHPDRRNLPGKARTGRDQDMSRKRKASAGHDRDMSRTLPGHDQDMSRTWQGHWSKHTQSNKHTTHTHAKEQRPTQYTRCRLPLV